jgi:hypothetical protein
VVPRKVLREPGITKLKKKKKKRMMIKDNNKPVTILHNEPVGVMVPSRLVTGRCLVRISAGSSVIMTKNFRVFRQSLMHILRYLD